MRIVPDYCLFLLLQTFQEKNDKPHGMIGQLTKTQIISVCTGLNFPSSLGQGFSCEDIFHHVNLLRWQ